MRVYSVFRSFDGEVNEFGQGGQSIFIRLAGCNLKCPYCDAAYARDPQAGEARTIHELEYLVSQKSAQGCSCSKVTITGGEPLLQYEELTELIPKLSAVKPTALASQLGITIETNGTLKPSLLGEARHLASFVMDYKLDQEDAMDLDAFDELGKGDWVKFVVEDKEEFDRALTVIDYISSGRPSSRRYAIGVKWGRLANGILAEWILASGRDIVLNTQLHKLIGLKESR